jgi:uncharacterized protein
MPATLPPSTAPGLRRSRTALLKTALTLLGVLLGVTLGASLSHAASFDCTKAATLVEQAVCANPRLSRLDEDLASLYREAVRKDATIRTDQQNWLKQRNLCRNEPCLIGAYEQRLAELADFNVRYDRHMAANTPERVTAPAPVAPAPSTAVSRSTGSAGGATTDEVGDRVLVIEPRAKPIFVARSGTRYWPCQGLVNSRLIASVHEDLKALSERHGVPAPQPAPCLYSIGTLTVPGASVEVYQMDFYVDRASMESCLVSDVCKDFRSMTFKPDGKNIRRTYMVTSYQRRLTAMACSSLEGKVISSTQACQ